MTNQPWFRYYLAATRHWCVIVLLWGSQLTVTDNIVWPWWVAPQPQIGRMRAGRWWASPRTSPGPTPWRTARWRRREGGWPGHRLKTEVGDYENSIFKISCRAQWQYIHNIRIWDNFYDCKATYSIHKIQLRKSRMMIPITKTWLNKNKKSIMR